MRHTATAAIVLTTGLLLSACSSSSDDEATDPASSSSSSSSSTPTTSASASPTEDASAGAGSDDVAPASIPGLALTAADFPAPYTFTPLPDGALEAGGEAIGGALGSATYTPAECGNASQASQGADLSSAGVAIGVDQASGTSVTSVLSPAVDQAVDIEELAKTCASFTFSLAGPDGSPLKGDATLELLPAPDVDADDARAVKTSVTITVAGQTQTIDTVVYTAQLRGVSVVSSASGLSTTPADPAVLQDVLVAGIDKVRSAP